MEPEQITPEWSHEIEADQAGEDILKLNISPSEDEREKLIKRLEIKDLQNLEADLKFNREQAGTVIHVTGVFRAKVIQDCVVTLKPIENTLEEKFEAWYGDAEQAVSLNKVKRIKELEEEFGSDTPVLDEKDDPEPVIDGKIDVGELVTQYLSLAINPYPHAEGAEFEVGDDQPLKDIPQERRNPFAALKDWKEKLENEDT